MYVQFALAAIMTLLVQTSWAQGYRLGTPVVSGPGCPSNTASASVSPDGSAISILFDQFGIRKAAGEFSDRTSCSIRIPIEVEPGFWVVTSSVEYRGFANIPRGVRGRIVTRGALQGRRHPHQTASTEMNWGTDDFYISQTVQQNFPADRSCETNDEISFNTELQLTSGNAGRTPRPFPADAELILDSADAGASEIKLGMRIRPCRGQGRNGDGRGRNRPFYR